MVCQHGRSAPRPQVSAITSNAGQQRTRNVTELNYAPNGIPHMCNRSFVGAVMYSQSCIESLELQRQLLLQFQPPHVNDTLVDKSQAWLMRSSAKQVRTHQLSQLIALQGFDLGRLHSTFRMLDTWVLSQVMLARISRRMGGVCLFAAGLGRPCM